MTIDAVDGGPGRPDCAQAQLAAHRLHRRPGPARGRTARKRQRLGSLRPRPSGREPDVGLVWAGEGTDLITAVEPAGNLVAQIVTQTERLLRGTSRLAAPDPVRRHPRGHIAQFCTSRPKITTGIEART